MMTFTYVYRRNKLEYVTDEFTGIKEEGMTMNQLEELASWLTDHIQPELDRTVDDSILDHYLVALSMYQDYTKYLGVQSTLLMKYQDAD